MKIYVLIFFFVYEKDNIFLEKLLLLLIKLFIPKGPLSALVCNYWDFDYTSSDKGFRMADLFAFWSLFGEIWGPAISQYSYRKNLATCVAQIWSSSVLVRWNWAGGGELALVQIDFFAASEKG